MTTTDKIQWTDEKETLFIPLYGRALDYRSKNSILNDITANDIIEKVDTELTKQRRLGSSVLAVCA